MVMCAGKDQEYKQREKEKENRKREGDGKFMCCRDEYGGACHIRLYSNTTGKVAKLETLHMYGSAFFGVCIFLCFFLSFLALFVFIVLFLSSRNRSQSTPDRW